LSNRNTLLESQATFTNVFMCKCVKEYRRSGVRWKNIFIYTCIHLYVVDYLWEGDWGRRKKLGKWHWHYRR